MVLKDYNDNFYNKPSYAWSIKLKANLWKLAKRSKNKLIQKC